VGRVSAKIRQGRVDWLIANQPVWVEWPYFKESFATGLLFAYTDQIAQACVAGMKEAGLVSPKTWWCDVRIGQYIDKARHEIGVFN